MKHLILSTLLILCSMTSVYAGSGKQAYFLRLATAYGDFYLNMTDGYISIEQEPQDIYLYEQEDGKFGIADSDGNYLVYKGGDRWTMTTSAGVYGWTIQTLPEGGYSITGDNGQLGTNDYNGNAAGSQCYGDKLPTNGNVVWSIIPRESFLFLNGNYPTITVGYNGSSAFVYVPSEVNDVTYAVDRANVVITSATTSREYAYNVSGVSDNGSLQINGTYKLTLQLNGIQLGNSNGPAIDIECGKRIAVELVEGTENTLVDGINGAHKAAFYFTGHPEFQGGGALNVVGQTKHAICAKEYLQIKKSTGFINVLGAVSDGIHCGKGKVNNEHNYFEMRGGIVRITNVGGDGIDADDYGVIRMKGGALNINISADGAEGLKADSIVTISDGLVNVFASGRESTAIKANYHIDISGGEIKISHTGDGSKAIKSKNAKTTVTDGGTLSVSGGEIEIYALGKNLYEEIDTTKCLGISVDSDMLQTDGDIFIYALGSDSKGYKVKGEDTRTGGSLSVVRAPWKMNPFEYRYDMSSYVVVEIDDNLLTDYDNYAVGAFIGEACVGVARFDKNYGELRVRSNTAEEDSISFCLYDYDTEEELSLTPDRDILFQSMACYGTPSSPVVLRYHTPSRLIGDVNEDGVVDINDVVAIINHIAGTAYWRYANVNEDSDTAGNPIVDINDVVAVINIMANN